MRVPPQFPRLALLVAAALLGMAAPADAREPRAVVAFLPASGEPDAEAALERLAARPQLALGLLSATQGSFSPQQMMLDMSAGSRTSRSVYSPRQPPPLALAARGGEGQIRGWSAARSRARTALAEIDPGMLAAQIPGGVAYAGVASARARGDVEAVVAADRAGKVVRVSLGPAATLAERVSALQRRHRLVVARLPDGARGEAELDELVRGVRPDELLLVVQSPPRTEDAVLLPIGAVGLRGRGGSLTSQTTHLDGIVAGIDVPVTVLSHLGLAVPDGVRGQPMRAEGERATAELVDVEARLRVVSGRRIPTLAALLLAWLAVVLGLGVVADRRGVRAGLRIGALAMLWVLPMLLVTAAVAPPRLTEIAIVVVGAFVLGAVTDRFVAFPRAPLVPAAAAVVGYGVDLAFGSPLIIRSLLGVNPRSGSRFYGLGNELESTLVVLLLLGLGALLHGRDRSRPAAAVFAVAGAIFAVFVGAGQLGADVGGIITLGAGVVTATLLMLPGQLSRRTIVLAALVPLVALVALALLDLATGGNGHFTRTILQADSAGSLWDVVQRRYTLAFRVFGIGAMPLVTLVALLGVAYAIRYRDRIYAPLAGSPAWRAALIGGLTAATIGALTNDSGPMLFVFGVLVLACATAYVRGARALGRT